jgi:hypothetical protein
MSTHVAVSGPATVGKRGAVAAFILQDLRQIAAKWRARESRPDLVRTGFVVIYHGGAIGWTSDVKPDAKSWVPCCFAVPVTGPIFIATGGSGSDGAEKWEEVRS